MLASFVQSEKKTLKRLTLLNIYLWLDQYRTYKDGNLFST